MVPAVASVTTLVLAARPSADLASAEQDAPAWSQQPVLPWVVGALVAALILLLGYGLHARPRSRVFAQAAAAGTDVGGQAASSGHFSVVFGADGRPSTSKLAAYSWTVALAAALSVLLSAAVLNDGVTPADLGLGTIQQEYLVLLGVPYGSLVAAKLITQSKVERRRLVKTTRGVGSGSGGGFLSDDDGRLSLSDTQYVVFNALLLAYFLVAFVETHAIPDLPMWLVGLTGGAGAVYVGMKAAESQPVEITSAQVMGSQVRIRGRNLVAPWVVDGSGARAVTQLDLVPYVTVEGMDPTAVTKVEWLGDFGVDVTLRDAAAAANVPAAPRVSLQTLGGLVVGPAT